MTKRKNGRPRATKPLWTMHLRATPEERRQITEAAQRAGLTIGDYLMQSAQAAVALAALDQSEDS